MKAFFRNFILYQLIAGGGWTEYSVRYGVLKSLWLPDARPLPRNKPSSTGRRRSFGNWWWTKRKVRLESPFKTTRQPLPQQQCIAREPDFSKRRLNRMRTAELEAFRSQLATPKTPPPPLIANLPPFKEIQF